ncbi:MAG: hypothetical protein ABI528_00930 [bacterium]
MPKIFSTYFLKALSLILLSGFLFTNLSFCEILTESCTPETLSCCCKQHEQSREVSYQKSCCCEVKQAPVQAESSALNTQILTKITPEDVHLPVNHLYSNYNFSDSDQHPVPYHPPPDSDLNILYSVLRI